MMNRYSLSRNQRVPKPLEEVFAFFSKPENLRSLTPKKLGFEILTPSPIEMRHGALIDYTIKVFGLRKRWTTLITSYHPPYQFVDEQLRGPYSFWHHTHLFTETNEGTLITDEIEYALAYGWAGRIVHELIVKPQLERVFEFRSRTIEQLFGAAEQRHNQNISETMRL